MKNKNTLTYVLGALLIGFGVIFIISPKEAFENVVSVAAIALILLSLFSIITSLKENELSSYFIATSILGLIFGIILLINTDSAVKIIPTLLGMYLLITGLSKLLLLLKNKYTIESIISPVIKTILGVIFLFTPVVPIIITGIILGVFLVLTGITTITDTKDNEVVYKVKVKQK